jgi:hypothetical protein
MLATQQGGEGGGALTVERPMASKRRPIPKLHAAEAAQVWALLGRSAEAAEIEQLLHARGYSAGTARRLAKRFDARYQDQLRRGATSPPLSAASDLVEGDVASATHHPAVSPKSNWASAAVAGLVLVLGGAFMTKFKDRMLNAGDPADIGKPCQSPSDCPRNASCMMEMDANRRITGGYCTIACEDSTDCNGNTTCGQAVDIGAQGADWDGTFGSTATVCLRH